MYCTIPNIPPNISFNFMPITPDFAYIKTASKILNIIKTTTVISAFEAVFFFFLYLRFFAIYCTILFCFIGDVSFCTFSKQLGTHLRLEIWHPRFYILFLQCCVSDQTSERECDWSNLPKFKIWRLRHTKHKKIIYKTLGCHISNQRCVPKCLGNVQKETSLNSTIPISFNL